MKKLLALLLLPVLASCGPNEPKGPSDTQWKGYQQCMADIRRGVREYNNEQLKAEARIRAAGGTYIAVPKSEPLFAERGCARENGIDPNLVD